MPASLMAISPTGTIPNSDVPGMKYADDSSWSQEVFLGNGLWEEVVPDLEPFDENGNKYYKDNIQEYLDDVNKAGDIDMKEDEKIQWLYDHIGKDYIDKFLLVKEQI